MHSQAPGFSPVPVSSPEVRFSVLSGARSLPSSQFQSSLSVYSGAPVFSLDACVLPSSWAPSFSLVPVSAPELWFSVWSHTCSQAHGLSLLSRGCQSLSLACSPVQVATASQCLSTAAPSPFHLSSDICVRIHSSPLHTSILSTGDVRL